MKLRDGSAQTRTHRPPDPYLELHTGSFEGEHWKNGRQLLYLLKIVSECPDCCGVATSTARQSPIFDENAHIMLEMAAKCSNYARN